MILIGRIPVPKPDWRVLCVFCVLSARTLAVNAQDSEEIGVPLPADLPRVSALDTNWVAPPGHVTDRQLVNRLARFQEAVRGPRSDDFNWNEELEQVHSGILALREDTLVTASTEDVADGAPAILFSPQRTVLRSVKSVTEEIIGDLPPEGREAWLRLISQRASAELRQAAVSGDWSTIRRIASQDVHTPAGYDAIDRLANWYLDQNRPLAAIRQFQRLLYSDEARQHREPELSLRTAAAWTRLRRLDQARLALFDLTRWLKTRPDVLAGTSRDAIPDASLIPEWINQIRSGLPTGRTFGKVEPFSAPGLLPRAEAASFSPDSRTLWKSTTNGFNLPATSEGRSKFQYRIEDEEINASDPYPESKAESAALVEVGLEHLERRDRRHNAIALPACEPVIVDGHVLFRTLNRIRSVDLKTGAMVWESFLADPAFEEQFDLRRARQSINVPKESHDITNPLNQRQSAVIHSRTRIDRTAGTMSTDGQLLFTLEDGGVAARATAYNQPGLRQAAPRSWNRLCAFDVRSGILRWQIGGPEGEYRLAAAGVFFLGAPTVIEDSIYVLGEQSTWIRLFCLDPATGSIKWAQPVATAEAAVSDEGLRRVGGISPRNADGLIICPSLSGMIVAFDPSLQRLAWTAQYRTQVLARMISPRPVLHRPSLVNTSNLESDDRWRHDSLFVTDGRVITTPLDSQEMICLDAVSGDTLWTQSRGQGVFVGAAFDDQVIVVDDSAVRSVRLEDGTLNWIVRLNQRIPTGRGLRVGSLFHLPVMTVQSDQTVTDDVIEGVVDGDDSNARSGRLVTIDLVAGRVLAESGSPDGQPLGNIVSTAGHLLTQRFDSVVAMESLSSVESQLAEQLDRNPGDARSLESRARIRLHEGRQQEGLKDLQLAVASQQSGSALSLLVEQALEQLRLGQPLSDETQRVLADAQLTAEQRNSLDAVRFRRLLAENKPVAAFDVLLATPQTRREDEAPFIVHADPLSISSTAWVAAQLRTVYEAASSDSAVTEQLDSEIRSQLESAIQADGPESLRRWLSKFAWHDLATRARLSLAERLDPEQDVLERFSLWAGLLADSDDQIASRADKHLPQAAAPAVWPGTSPVVTTDDHSLSPERRILIDVAGRRSPLIEGWEFELSIRGLTAISPTGQSLWTLTDQDLGSEPVLTTSRHSGSRIFSCGYLLAVSTGTEFSVFDIRESSPRRLWMRSFVSPDAEGFLNVKRTHLLGSSILISGSTPIASVDFLNSHSLVYRTGSTLRVVEATTGETIWTRDRISPEALIFGDERILVVADVRSVHCQSFDLSSGRLIKEHFDLPLNPLLATDGTSLIVRQRRGAGHVISRFDALSGEAVWEQELPDKSSTQTSSQNHLIELHPDGIIRVRDLSTGRMTAEVQGEPQQTPGAFFLHETPTEYVLFTATPQRAYQTRTGPLNLQGARQDKVDGPAYGIDRRTGKLLWTVNVESQYFSVGQPSQLPFVVLGCWSSEARPRGTFSPSNRTYRLRILDTRTGETVFSTDEEEDVMNFLSQGDPSDRKASVTFGTTVVRLDYPPSSETSRPQQD